MPRLFAPLALALLAWAVQGASQETRGALKRLTLRQDMLGWEAVGRLDLGGQGFCTGVLIAPDLVLTAAHCIVDTETGEPRPATAMTFRSGYADGQAIAESKGAAAVFDPAFEARGDLTGDRVRHDVGLVVLATPIPTGRVAPFRVDRPARGLSEVSVVSYARGRAEAPSREHRCRVLGQQDGLLAFDCDVDFGSSGAPVFRVDGRRPSVVSIISAGAELDGKRVALGMNLPALVDALKAQVRARPSAPPTRRIGPGGADAARGGVRFVRP